jgi:hypothetical protein
MKWILLTHFERFTKILAVLCTIRQVYMVFCMLSHFINQIERNREELDRLEALANERLQNT